MLRWSIYAATEFRLCAARQGELIDAVRDERAK